MHSTDRGSMYPERPRKYPLLGKCVMPLPLDNSLSLRKYKAIYLLLYVDNTHKGVYLHGNYLLTYSKNTYMACWLRIGEYPHGEYPHGKSLHGMITYTQ